MTRYTPAARRYRRRLRVCIAQGAFLLVLAAILLIVFDPDPDRPDDPWVWCAVVPVVVWTFAWYLAVFVSGERTLYRDCDLAGYTEIKKYAGAPYDSLPAAKWQSACMIDFFAGRFDRVLAIEGRIRTFYVRQNPELLTVFAAAGYYGGRPEAAALACACFKGDAVAGRGGAGWRFADAATEAIEDLLSGRAGQARKTLEALSVRRGLRAWEAIRLALLLSACVALGDEPAARETAAALTGYGDFYFAQKAKRFLAEGQEL